MNAQPSASAHGGQNPAYSTPKSTLFLKFSSLTGLWCTRTFPPLKFLSAMANTKSALKYIRKTETRSLRNRQVKSRLKTFAKKVEAASAARDKEALAVAARKFISTLDKAGKNGLVHPNKIARHKARCAQLLAA